MTYQPFNASDFKVGDRVQLAPHTDTWVRGDRYGVITTVGVRSIRVKLDRSGRTQVKHPSHISEIVAN